MSYTYRANIIIGIRVELRDLGIVEEVDGGGCYWTAKPELWRLFYNPEIEEENEKDVIGTLISFSGVREIKLGIFAGFQANLMFFAHGVSQEMVVGVKVMARASDEEDGFADQINFDRLLVIQNAVQLYLTRAGLEKPVGLILETWGG